MLKLAVTVYVVSDIKPQCCMKHNQNVWQELSYPQQELFRRAETVLPCCALYHAWMQGVGLLPEGSPSIWLQEMLYVWIKWWFFCETTLGTFCVWERHRNFGHRVIFHWSSAPCDRDYCVTSRANLNTLEKAAEQANRLKTGSIRCERVEKRGCWKSVCGRLALWPDSACLLLFHAMVLLEMVRRLPQEYEVRSPSTSRLFFVRKPFDPCQTRQLELALKVCLRRNHLNNKGS